MERKREIIQEHKGQLTDCLGRCGVLTGDPTGYCSTCRPEEDVTDYDFEGADNEG